jgi:hypothetical protein
MQESAIPITNPRPKKVNPNDSLSAGELLDRYEQMLEVHKDRGVRVVLYNEFEDEAWTIHFLVPIPPEVTPRRVLSFRAMTRSERRDLMKGWLKKNRIHKKLKSK